MVKNATAFLVLLLGLGCDIPKPPPPGTPPPEIEAPANCAGTGGEWLGDDGCRCEFTKVYTMEKGCACPDELPLWNEELKKCELPAPPAEPPPTAEQPKPEDYIALERVEGILNGTSSKSPGLIANNQHLAWAGWRDPHYVLAKCGFACESSWIGMNCDELGDFGTRGQELVQFNETNLIPRFAEVNRRCKDDETFCDVTNIRKEVWEPHRLEIDAHLAEATKLHDRAYSCRAAIMASGQLGYDSIQGFCRKMNAGQVPLTACPQ